ncbi:unnamed protein product [Euphydryas editha]|uniref:Uncharacterized protein n=1 Tax=Euphydryas editha TaxID=104508 RepID=A0AAU9V4Q1_EUPED|nr:unnamed protein product [Euphydryas editha]
MNDSLKKENSNKEREIRRLNKDIQHYEQTITSLRNELSISNFRTPDVPKKDAEVMADICFSNKHECNEEPVKESESAAQEHPMYQEHIHQLEHSVKSTSDFRSLRQMNVALREELRAMQRVCAALDEQCRLAALRAQFKDDVIHEMRRQLKQAKSKLKEVSESKSVNAQKGLHHDIKHKSSASYDSLTIACVQQQPRRNGRVRPDMDMNINWDNNNVMYDGSGDDASSKAE